MLLAGDLGGTTTPLASYDASESACTPIVQNEYRSAGCASLDVMVRQFLVTSRRNIT